MAEENNPIREEDMLLADIGRSLRQTQPWVLFLSVLGALGSLAICGLGGMVMMIGGVASGIGRTGVDGSEELAGFGVFMGLFYVMLALFYAVPAALMARFGVLISGASTGDVAAIARAVRAQRDIWAFIGGSMLLLLILYCGGTMLMVVVGMAASNP